MNIPGLTALTGFLTDMLTALERTSLLFWQDRKPPTWVEAITLCTGQFVFYELAQFGYAGDGPRVGGRAILYMIFLAVALVQIFSGRRLGPVSRFGPSLMRLISVALYLGSSMIFLNKLLPWVEFVGPLPEPLGRHRGMACLVSGCMATALLTIHTVKNQGENARNPWGALLIWAVLLVVITSFLLYWGVIPHVYVG